MPYEYRKLSPQEREKIVKYRRERGYPLHAPPHAFRDAGAYLISATNFEHKPIMKAPARRTEFEILLLNGLKEIDIELIAWVVLPNHYHFLATIHSLDDISEALKLLHGRTSRNWNLEDDFTGKRRVWYKFADTSVRDHTHLHTAFNYIHHNPVKHGYVSSPENWHWSSLALYYGDKGRTWLEDHWQEYQPSSHFGKGWDDDIAVND